MLFNYLWQPVKFLGNKINFIRIPYQIAIFIVSVISGVYLLNNAIFNLNATYNQVMAILFASLGVMVLLKSFTCRKSAAGAWSLIIMHHCYMVLALSCKERFYLTELIIYLSGVSVSGLFGFYCLWWLKKSEGNITLNRYYGYSIYHPKLEIVFLLSCLGLMAFPISPTFLGEDLLFAHIGHGQFILAFLVSISFILCGISVIRIYARMFMVQQILPHAIINKHFRD